jgi:hypothetical protein
MLFRLQNVLQILLVAEFSFRSLFQCTLDSRPRQIRGRWNCVVWRGVEILHHAMGLEEMGMEGKMTILCSLEGGFGGGGWNRRDSKRLFGQMKEMHSFVESRAHIPHSFHR